MISFAIFKNKNMPLKRVVGRNFGCIRLKVEPFLPPTTSKKIEIKEKKKKTRIMLVAMHVDNLVNL